MLLRHVSVHSRPVDVPARGVGVVDHIFLSDRHRFPSTPSSLAVAQRHIEAALNPTHR
jgi:hypothetical protein